MTSAGDLNPLIDSIHDAGLGRSRWTDVLCAVAERIGAQCIALQIDAPGSDWSLKDWTGIDPACRRAYEDHYLALDPLVPFVAARCQPVTVVTDPMIVSRPVLVQTEFYEDWARPQGLNHFAGANLLTGDGIRGVLGAGRGIVAPYRQRDIDVLASLLPHIGNAVRTGRHLGNVRLREKAESDALDALAHAVVIVDSEARVIFANHAAEAMLNLSAGIATTHQRLVGPTASSTGLLRALIQGATRTEGKQRVGGAVLLEPPPAGPLQVLVTPLGSRQDMAGINAHGPAAMLILLDSHGANRGLEARLTALFGLTPAQARIAYGVAQGQSPNDIAETLRVMPSTVRTHLHHVFAKTATRGQGDLIRLIGQITTFRLV